MKSVRLPDEIDAWWHDHLRRTGMSVTTSVVRDPRSENRRRRGDFSPEYRGVVTWKYDGPDYGPSFPYTNQVGAIGGAVARGPAMVASATGNGETEIATSPRVGASNETVPSSQEPPDSQSKGWAPAASGETGKDGRRGDRRASLARTGQTSERFAAGKVLGRRVVAASR